jgi:DNA-binding MarR family transcriptional regulator
MLVGQAARSTKALGLYRFMQELFALDSSMPVSQALILLFIASREGGQGASVTDVAQALDIDLARASRNLKMLVDQGLVDQFRHPGEYRIRLSRLSEKGGQFLDRASGFIT